MLVPVMRSLIFVFKLRNLHVLEMEAIILVQMQTRFAQGQFTPIATTLVFLHLVLWVV
jgi:hypothetical protein